MLINEKADLKLYKMNTKGGFPRILKAFINVLTRELLPQFYVFFQSGFLGCSLEYEYNAKLIGGG